MDAIKPVRRLVCIDNEAGQSCALADAPAPDVRLDPARPGFALTRLWVADGAPPPLRGVRETLHLPHVLEPPARGSVLRVLTFPPDAAWSARVGEREVAAWFAAVGAPDASTYQAGGLHPYMQRTRTLDFCLVLEGEITLILDTEEVDLHAGDTVVQRGTNHAWSNRSNRVCRVAFSSHDGAFGP